MVIRPVVGFESDQKTVYIEVLFPDVLFCQLLAVVVPHIFIKGIETGLNCPV